MLGSAAIQMPSDTRAAPLMAVQEIVVARAFKTAKIANPAAHARGTIGICSEALATT